MRYKRLNSCYLVLVLFFNLSCYVYTPVALRKKNPAGAESGAFFGRDNPGETLYSWQTRSERKDSYRNCVKYYMLLKGGGPVSGINNRAVSCALEERYFEAEILLSEALEEAPAEPAILNNYAVIYEASGRREKSFEMYIKACALDPENKRMKHNFLSFEENIK